MGCKAWDVMPNQALVAVDDVEYSGSDAGHSSHQQQRASHGLRFHITFVLQLNLQGAGLYSWASWQARSGNQCHPYGTAEGGGGLQPKKAAA